MQKESPLTPESFMFKAADVRFEREDENKVLIVIGERKHEVGTIAMAFPLSNRAQMIAVRDYEGRELGIIDNLSRLDPMSRRIARDEMEKSYFLPRIKDVFEVEEKLGVATWKVETDRGLRTFQVRRPRQNLRKIGHRRLIIRDVDGNRYEITDWTALPTRSKRLFEEYI